MDRLEMRPRVGERRPVGAAPSAGGMRELSARFERSRRGMRPIALAPAFVGFTPSLLQQSVVIVRWVPNRGSARWRAHGRYLARGGAQPEGQAGQGFNASEQEIDIADRLGGWERAGEPRLWKLIISPEAGERLDLRQHALELMTTMEGDLGIRFRWVGIAHFDTAHPHLHVAIRGRSEEGVEFRMPQEYLREGIRLRSQELATQRLGFRFGRDLAAARERSVEARRYNDLDEALVRRADPQGRIEFEPAVPVLHDARRERLLLLRRLGFLSSIGLARRVGKRRFELSEHHRSTLERMHLTSSIRRGLMRYGELLVDPHAPLSLGELLPGVEIRGRVAGEAEDEAGRRTLLILEGMDGKVHLVPQTPEIEEHRGRDEVLRGEIVTLRALPTPPGSERMVRVEITRHGRLSELEASLEPSTVLDLEAVRSVRSGHNGDPIEGPSSSFRRELREAIARRVPLLEEQGLLEVVGAEDGEYVGRLAATPDAEERIERVMRERDRVFTPLSKAERVYGMPVVHAKLEPGRVYQGRVVAITSDSEGRAHILLHTDSRLTAVPAVTGAFQIGREIRALAVARQDHGEPRWNLAWRFDELEQERMQGPGRER